MTFEAENQQPPPTFRTKQKSRRFQQLEEETQAKKRQQVEQQQQQTQPIQQETCVNPTDTSCLENGKSSSMTPREVLGLPDLPPATNELTAILQFGTSYELVEWLAQCL